MALLSGERSVRVARPSVVGRLALLAFGAIALLVVIAAIPGLPNLNPFQEETKDRSQPVLLRSLERLSEYRAATANMEVVVDIEQDARFLPSFLKGEKVLFVAAGNVDAAVDFARLDKGAVQVSDDRKAVTITLPPARLTEARVDPERSRVFDRDRGLLDRVGSVFEDSPTGERELFVLAESKLREAAASPRSGLLAAGERNTRAMLEGMMRGLGFERVTVRFARPPV